ncbi:MAG TPA: N-6 DNA methylase, partial [Blastocatellia bacterium]|nr:N-6 DNA methylase [Blastocatellia bacterium]
SLIPIVAAAIRATIEHPVEGTTGRTTAYRSTLWPYIINSDSIFSDYYLERLFPNDELVAFPEDEAKTLLKEIAKRVDSLRPSLASADADETKRKWCEALLLSALGIKAISGVRIVGQTGVFEPDYVVAQAVLSGKPTDEYQGKDAGGELACLIWVLAWRSELDAVQTNGEGDVLPMDLAQRALTASDVQWAVLTNGQKLRLLHKSTAHKPRSFLELDLAAVLDRRDAEALLAFRYCLGLFSGESFTEKGDHERTRLDRAVMESERHGKEISDELKQNVFRALEGLGDGFLAFLRANHDVLKAWREKKEFSGSLEAFLHSDELLTEIYHESLSLMYRLLFLFYSESRNLLPMENEVYRDSSLESMRDHISSVYDDPDKTKSFFSKGDAFLWDWLSKQLFTWVNKGWGEIIPAYNGGLFDPDQHEFLESVELGDYYLARAIDLLSRTRPRSGQQPGEGRKKITYRDLEIRHLGSIYEGILEYSALIADEDKAVITRGSGSKTADEYASVSELSRDEKQQLKEWQEAVDENPDNPRLPRGCKIAGFKEKGRYFLVFGGRESKRKSSGSYYTPDYIVQYIVDNTIGPLLRGEQSEADMKDVPLTSDQILDLKILDPAMGSGHFLVAATEYLARAYGDALIREGKDKNGMMSDEEFIRYKRMIAERCIYGVDINEMAVELAKLSIWLFTMDRGRPLSFLDHHLKRGNSLIGAYTVDLTSLPKFDTDGTVLLVPGEQLELRFARNIDVFRMKLRQIAMSISRGPTERLEDILQKKSLLAGINVDSLELLEACALWVLYCVAGDAARVGIRRSFEDQTFGLADKGLQQVLDVVAPFHWDVEFADALVSETGGANGFDAVLCNPPYIGETKDADRFDSNVRKIPRRRALYERKMDIYYCFIGLAIELLRPSGRLGFITTSYWLEADSARPLRSYHGANATFDKVVYFNDNV